MDNRESGRRDARDPGFAWITLLTDYGLDDGFVAACHGVLARLAPAARVLDVTHLVPPGDIRRGALVLAQTIPYLPRAAHVAVVDPGVGTARRPIAITAGGHALVGPDNGLLSWAADHLGGAQRAHEITVDPGTPRTFHGRDVFTPAAGRLAAGADLADLGPAVPGASLVRLPDPVSRVERGVAHGEVLTLDRFGNVQTSLTAAQLVMIGAAPGDQVRLLPSGEEIRYDAMFAGVAEGELVVYEDSAGLIAVAVNRGDAAARLGLRPGDTVRLTIATSGP